MMQSTFPLLSLAIWCPIAFVLLAVPLAAFAAGLTLLDGMRDRLDVASQEIDRKRRFKRQAAAEIEALSRGEA